jgi:hypothetical protein
LLGMHGENACANSEENKKSKICRINNIYHMISQDIA